MTEPIEYMVRETCLLVQETFGGAEKKSLFHFFKETDCKNKAKSIEK